MTFMQGAGLVFAAVVAVYLIVRVASAAYFTSKSQFERKE